MERRFSFHREEKLKKSNEIREVIRLRKFVSCRGAKLFLNPNGLQHNRIAFTFTRKYGNAVERNHSRRLSREVYRLIKYELKKGYDLVLMVYPGGNLSPKGLRRNVPGEGKPVRDVFSDRMDQLRFLFSRAGLLNSL